MLRAKQLGTLTQCARSFYLSGTRCGSADGASCTCSEDENCVPKRQSRSFKQKKYYNAAVYAPAKAGPQFSQDASRVISHQDCGYPASDSSPLNRKGNSDNCELTSVNDPPFSSKAEPGGFVKAGMTNAGMISELVNYRIPKTDSESQKCMISSTQPSNNKLTGGPNYTKSQPNSSVNLVRESNSKSTSSNYSGERTSKSAYVKSKQNVPLASSMTLGSPPDMKDQRQCVPHRAKSHSDNFGSDGIRGVRISEKRMAGVAMEMIGSSNKCHNPIRTAKMHRAAAPSASRSVRSVNSGHAIEEYYRTLQRVKWGPTTEEALHNLHCKLDPFQANQVLKLLRDPTIAFGFFKWLNSQPGFKHDEHTYTTMIGILGQARQFGAMKRLLGDMNRDGCQPTVVTFNRIIHAYGRANYLAEAVKVFQEMQEAGYEPDQVTFCTLIDIHAKAGYLEVALDLYQRMQEIGLSPDTFTYSAMVNCLGKAGHLAAAYKLFCEMINHGCTPNLVTYNIMIALQAKARNYPIVVKLYRDMQTAGFRPDKITYSIVMEVLGHCGKLEEAEAVFMEMTRDWIPDEPVYGLLVDLWGKTGNVDKARAWYHAMLDAGLRPNVPTCNSLLSAFLKVHRFADAYSVLANMLGLGLVPSLQTYTLLLSCCTKTSSEMGLCCQLMAITGHPAHTFLLSLPDATPDGANVRAHANNFFDLVHSEDRESKRGLVDAVIHFLHKSGLKEEAGLVWEVAAERNVYPDSVREKRNSYWLINLHVMSEGTAVTALSRTLAWFQRQMLASGIVPSRIDIITGWGRRSRVTGSSLVRQTVQDLLDLFHFPFVVQNGNSGCFVGCGEALNRWLLNSYVERMHLL